MLKAMLIDDEANALKLLTYLLEQIDEVKVVAAFSNPYESFYHIDTHRPDVIFLDIDMPQISGLDLAGQLLEKYPDVHIVFITAHDEYALNAFGVNAIDYILKPTSPKRLKQCIDKVIRIKNTYSKDLVQSISNEYRETIKKIFVYEDDNIVLLHPEEIYYIKASNKYTNIKTEKKLYHSNNPLKYFESKLSDCSFCKIHRSFIVNLNMIKGFTQNINYSYDIHFKNISDTIPVSRSKIKLLKELLEY
ncbi:LytTR family DNA-binding domain-containing protein [Wukongibacter baidiensis]|uniref:LytR/AlgR family response regulator transcription factor n=1 Tax=Wukongibacter baidiensis TaxID=1723361 RepID=UPI003D7FA307